MEKGIENFIEYKYVIFEDENEEVLVTRDSFVKNCAFGGMSGKITEMERGIFTLDEYVKANYCFIGCLINKKNEYVAKRSK